MAALTEEPGGRVTSSLLFFKLTRKTTTTTTLSYTDKYKHRVPRGSLEKSDAKCNVKPTFLPCKAKSEYKDNTIFRNLRGRN